MNGGVTWQDMEKRKSLDLEVAELKAALELCRGQRNREARERDAKIAWLRYALQRIADSATYSTGWEQREIERAALEKAK